MVFPERFSNLSEHVWPRLRALLDPHAPGGDVIHMTIGEPRHPFPPWIIDTLAQNAEGFGKYPANHGTPALLDAISNWINRRFGVRLPEDQILALNGTREGLYNAAMALCPETKNGKTPIILVPDPFYPVYAVAGLSVGADVRYIPATAETGHLPDYASLPKDVLDQTAIAYICSPANPQGAVASPAYWAELIALAERHDFLIFSDECYSEIYASTPPMGALEAAARAGAHPERVVIFHSLSKRSNLPGLRSGFAAGGPEAIARMRQLRAYAGAPLPDPVQAVSAALWADEHHVEENRARYQRKFAMANEIFADIPGCDAPEGGFFLWLPAERGGEASALHVWKETGVRVLPGGYLARGTDESNPGTGYIRVALVAEEEEMQRGLIQIRDCLYT